MRKIVQILGFSILFSSCATIFIPKKQKITINTEQDKAVVYVNKEEFGTGSSVTGKVDKKRNDELQVVVKAEGYKDEYYALLKTHRPIAFWPLQILNAPFFLFYGGGMAVDFPNPKLKSFNKINECHVNYKIQKRKDTEKYIDISNIKLSIKDKNKDIKYIRVPYVEVDLENQIKIAEKNKDTDMKTSEMKELKKKSKKKGKLLDEDKEKGINYDDIKYSENVYKTLKNTGYIDTVNKVFKDNNNTLVLEGNIKKINVYNVHKKIGLWGFGSNYTKCKLYTTWYIKNTYNEVLDSIVSEDFSGDFALSVQGFGYGEEYQKNYNNEVQKMYADAVDVSYLKLHKNARFTKYLKQESDFAIKDQILNLPKPTANVLEKTDASAASVIIKRKDGGHGSGFAITNDGYIITNYHVVAGKFTGKLSEVKVITNEGQELEATVVRYNKFNDLALLKVSKMFEKAFTVSNIKAYKNMQDVYTIGAPKSIELGQSISAGVISNERKSNNNNLIQLGMSVNGGNSGGPLYDATGKLHGVIVSKLVGQNTEGVSFAIPGYLIEEYLKLKIN